MPSARSDRALLRVHRNSTRGALVRSSEPTRASLTGSSSANTPGPTDRDTRVDIEKIATPPASLGKPVQFVKTRRG